MLPGPALPGCCLVSLHFLCYILCGRSVDIYRYPPLLWWPKNVVQGCVTKTAIHATFDHFFLPAECYNSCELDLAQWVSPKGNWPSGTTGARTKETLVTQYKALVSKRLVATDLTLPAPVCGATCHQAAFAPVHSRADAPGIISTLIK